MPFGIFFISSKLNDTEAPAPMKTPYAENYEDEAIKLVTGFVNQAGEAEHKRKETDHAKLTNRRLACCPCTRTPGRYPSTVFCPQRGIVNF